MTEQQEQPKLDGWKTKWGGILMAFGSAIGAASEVAPDPVIAKWMIFLGVLIGGFGTALLGVGIGHKVQKSGTTKAAMAILGILAMMAMATPAFALNWTTANQATVGWDAVTTDVDGDPIPAGFEVRYKVFLINAATDPDKSAPTEISTAGGIIETRLTFSLEAKGKYFVGAQAVQVDIENGEEVAKSRIAWSDKPEDCANGQDFGIRYYVALAAPGGMRPVASP